MIRCFNGCWKRRWKQLKTRGHQRPLLSRELPSVWPASLRIDRGAPWRKRTGRSDHSGFEKPCHVERSSNLNLTSKIHLLLLQHHPQSLSIKPNIHMCGIMSNGGISGFCWRVSWTSLATGKSSKSGMSLAICGIIPMKTHTVQWFSWHGHKIWWTLYCGKTEQKKWQRN